MAHILTYHSIDPSGSVISTHPEVFSAQMRELSDRATRVVPLREIADDADAVAITFDDGFSNFIEHALPVLERFKFPATVFAVGRYAGRDNGWPTQLPGIPVLPLMRWNELARIGESGIDVGAHTLTHPFLSKLTHADMEAEIRGSKVELEDQLQKEVQLFSYPYGFWNETVREVTKKYFDVCCTTELAYVGSDSDPWALPRIDAYYVRSLFWFSQMPSQIGKTYIRAQRCARAARQLLET